VSGVGFRVGELSFGGDWSVPASYLTSSSYTGSMDGQAAQMVREESAGVRRASEELQAGNGVLERNLKYERK